MHTSPLTQAVLSLTVHTAIDHNFVSDLTHHKTCFNSENSYVNPTLHGLKNVAGYTGGGHYGHPLENYPGGHFCGQIDL